MKIILKTILLSTIMLYAFSGKMAWSQTGGYGSGSKYHSYEKKLRGMQRKLNTYRYFYEGGERAIELTKSNSGQYIAFNESKDVNSFKDKKQIKLKKRKHNKYANPFLKLLKK